MSISITLTNRQHGTEVQVTGDDAEECADVYEALVVQLKSVGGYKGAGSDDKRDASTIAKYEAIRAAKARRAARNAENA